MLRKALNNYLKHLSEKRRLSPGTVATYRLNLARWVDFLENESRDNKPDPKVNAVLLRRFLAGRRRQNVSARTLAGFISALAGFQRYLAHY